MLLTQAQLLLATDGLKASERIEKALSEATVLIEAMDARGLAPFICVERAQLARLHEDEALFLNQLKEAHRQFRAIGATGNAERIAMELSVYAGKPA